MKRYRIADLLVDMDVSGQTARQATPYAVDAEGPADITLKCDVRRILELNPDVPTEDMAEYLGLGKYFAQALLAYDGSFLHASAVVWEGKAYLFSATSGTGKSTHTEKWCRLFGAECLNDDKPALRCINGVWMAYGTPWSGKHDLSIPAGFPIGGIAFLERGQENSIRRITPAEALPRFMSQSLWRLGNKEALSRQLSLADRLLKGVPVWQLACRNEDEAARVSHSAMTAQEK